MSEYDDALRELRVALDGGSGAELHRAYCRMKEAMLTDEGLVEDPPELALAYERVVAFLHGADPDHVPGELSRRDRSKLASALTVLACGLVGLLIVFGALIARACG